MKLVVSNGRDLRVYDISGSANRVNKTDLGLIIHRDPDRDSARTDVLIRKVRFKEVEKIGGVLRRWDRVTGQYAEIAAGRAYAARASPVTEPGSPGEPPPFRSPELAACDYAEQLPGRAGGVSRRAADRGGDGTRVLEAR